MPFAVGDIVHSGIDYFEITEVINATHGFYKFKKNNKEELEGPIPADAVKIN
ncbi:hypothetical protein SI65_07339 [Aspergillus cristatus]|uniref:Uncharacterized protein n=1 Tax=Aspergillus cristatus TaxID=573508 RepID=A0A1E3B823_ASPCR|nr:hypothetical protein SI65_07339 [Aspergillus cristatus]